jgi:hypothetical protein
MKPTSVDIGTAENDIVAAAMSFTAARAISDRKNQPSFSEWTKASELANGLERILFRKCRFLKKLQRAAMRNNLPRRRKKK